jgi:hypothetical protein
MAISRNRRIQLTWLAVCGALLGAAALLQEPLNQASAQYELVAPGNQVLQNHPEFVLLQIAPGGLRALAVNYLWIRAETLKNDGKFYESMQEAEII